MVEEAKMLKGYAKPIVFSMLVGMLMLTGVYTYALQQTGVVPISVVLANDNNQFYKLVIEATLPTSETVNYTITPEQSAVYIPAGATIKRFIPYMNVTEPYILLDPFSITVEFDMTYAINGVNSTEVFTLYPFSVAQNENIVTIAANCWFNKILSDNQLWTIYIWAISYLT